MSDLRYLAYLVSPHWRSVRARMLSTKRKRRCVACGSVEWLDVHHRTYERRGTELDADLVVLCRDCHNTVHAFAKARDLSLATATDRFVKGMTPLKYVPGISKADPEQYEIQRAVWQKRWRHPGATR